MSLQGEWFGMGGERYVRLNVATPRSVLERAMRKIANGIDKIVLAAMDQKIKL